MCGAKRAEGEGWEAGVGGGGGKGERRAEQPHAPAAAAGRGGRQEKAVTRSDPPVRPGSSRGPARQQLGRTCLPRSSCTLAASRGVPPSRMLCLRLGLDQTLSDRGSSCRARRTSARAPGCPFSGRQPVTAHRPPAAQPLLPFPPSSHHHPCLFARPARQSLVTSLPPLLYPSPTRPRRLNTSSQELVTARRHQLATRPALVRRRPSHGHPLAHLQLPSPRASTHPASLPQTDESGRALGGV